MNGPVRWAIGLLLAGAAVVGPVGVAHADPAEPSDYRSTVTAVNPETPAIHVEIVGGDSFVQLTVDLGTEVVVTGYDGEPFLRFLADGTVEENDHAPTTHLSRSRFGTEVPAGADASLPPAWERVGGAGRYSWHDHRAHWMSTQPPPNFERGDRIQEGIIALVVAGEPVEITVATDWVPAPSGAPLYIGAGAGGAVLLLALMARRRVAWSLLAAATAATAAGWWQFSSLPSETGPLVVWWLLPAVAVASALGALVLGARLSSYALVLLGSLELGAWAVLRADGAFKAVLPTDAPYWLDRGVLAGSVVVAVGVAVGGVVGLARGDERT